MAKPKRVSDESKGIRELGQPTTFIIGAINIGIYYPARDGKRFSYRERLESVLKRKYLMFFRESIKFQGSLRGDLRGYFGEECYRYTVFVTDAQSEWLKSHLLKLVSIIGGNCFFEHAGKVTLLNA